MQSAAIRPSSVRLNYKCEYQMSLLAIRIRTQTAKTAIASTKVQKRIVKRS